jgi:hypothetical protein
LGVTEFSQAECASFDQKAWIADYEMLRSHTTRVYANFLDKVKYGEVDPYLLNQQTYDAIRNAKTEREAFLALLRFVSAFKDNHFRIVNMPELTLRILPEKYIYPIRLSDSENTVVIKSDTSDHCKLPAGTKVEKIDGRPVDEVVKYFEGFFNEGNYKLRRSRALEVITSGSFFPAGLTLTARLEDKKQVTCVLKPKIEPRTARSLPNKAPVVGTMTGTEACAAMGIRKSKNEFPFQLSTIDEFTAVDVTPSFSAGVLRRSNSSPIGFMRVHAFTEDNYLNTCADEWEKLQPKILGACDAKCQWNFRYQKLRQRLIDDADLVIQALKQKGIGTLVVDVTGNGGGTDWVDVIARMVAGQSKLECQARHMIRHPSTTESMSAILAEVETDRKQSHLNPKDKLILDEAAAKLVNLIADSKITCDLSPFWTKRDFTANCNQLMTQHQFACGLFPYLPAGSLDGMESKQALFNSLDHKYEESRFKGKLAIVVDRETGSAAEDFAAMLQDNHQATIIGEATNGNGCGFVNGAVPIKLPHSGIEVKMSNCARIRRDGSNAVFGVKPDIEIPWVGDDSAVATKALLNALSP